MFVGGIGDSELMVGYFGDSELGIFWSRDFIKPIVILIGPSDGTEDTDGIVEFTYNVTDASSVDNCSFYLDNTLEQIHTSVTKGISQTFSVKAPPVKDNLRWYVSCRDRLNNLGNSFEWGVDTKLGGGTVAGSGGGGGSTPELIAKSLGITNISARMCELTYEEVEDKRYWKIYDIIDIYKEETNKTISWTEVRVYIDNWQEICGNYTKIEPLSVSKERKISPLLTWIILISVFLMITGYLVYTKKKKILILINKIKKGSIQKDNTQFR